MPINQQDETGAGSKKVAHINKGDSPKVGKLVFKATYIHREALDFLPDAYRQLARRAENLAGLKPDQANVFKLDIEQNVVSLLHYPMFMEEPFPILSEAWKVHLDDDRVVYRTYQDSLNPPILHRKELLLPPAHPRQDEFSSLTRQAEELGLFAESHAIGFRRHWEAAIRKVGYVLEGSNFQLIGNDLQSIEHSTENWQGRVERHRTALSRDGLSAPMQSLARNGLLKSELTYFDYGCGRGDDMRALQQNGIQVSGWDPHFLPEAGRRVADVVNLGFVLNVIDDPDERINALEQAFSLARQLLVVSVMLYTNATPVGKPYRDGYLTQRNTFQKYFTQSELKEYLEYILDTDVIPVAPGIMYVFADKQAEQRFLMGRQRNHHTLRMLGYRRERQPVVRAPRLSKYEALVAEHRDLLNKIWEECLELGRIPEVEETRYLPDAVMAFGNWGKTVRLVGSHFDLAELVKVASSRREDLLVYLALQQFAKRKAYKALDTTLQFDIKSFCGDYQKAQALARELLFGIADSGQVEEACRKASEKGLGYYLPGESLQLHVSLVEQLPALLRVYVGCGVVLYGDLEGVDLVKVHTQSTKVTLLKLLKFDESPLPRVMERVKVTLRQQEIDYFVYGNGSEYAPPLLYFKSRYINEEHPSYARQKEFDDALLGAMLFTPSGYGPSEAELVKLLRTARLEVHGFTLRGSTTIPGLDEPCGANFTYRDFIECGQTQKRLGISNVPKEPETYNALHGLATRVLDPVIDYFGAIKLTYGFASPELTRHIKARIAPKLDQHAAHEKNRLGRMVCERGGAACDFIVEDENMEEVVEWVMENISFDRIYYYGQSCPIHISWNVNCAGTGYAMSKTDKGGIIPKIIKRN